MPRTLEAVKELLQQVASERKKGDALRKVGQEDRARRAYEAGLARAEQAVDLLLQPPYDALPSAEPPLSTEHEQA